MSDSLATTQMRLWLDRIQGGDMAAREELVRTVCGRMERLTRKLLRDYPSVERWVEAEDVLQDSMLRLLRALKEVRPNSMREFFGLGALQIRRELLDLARRFKGREEANYQDGSVDNTSASGLRAPPAPVIDPDFDEWSAFHEAVELLPAEEREVVGLVFYHGWSQGEVAELFQVTERSVRRWWQSARLKLHGRLKTADVAE